MTTLLGLDPGLAKTGYGCIRTDGRTIHHIAHGVISTEAGQDEAERLLKIHRGIEEIIHLHKPQYAGIENLYFAKNVKTALPVAQARGVLLVTLAELGIAVYGFSPPVIKQALVGHGSATKEQVQEMVRLVLGLQTIPKPDHAADALAAAISLANHAASYGIHLCSTA